VPPEHENDAICLEQLKAGDDLALNRIMARWQRPLLSFARRYVRSESDAEDLVIEVFVRLYQNRQKLRKKTNLPAWLFTTLTNLCLNHLRWQKRHPSVGGSEIETGPYPENEPATPWTEDSAHPGEAMEQDERVRALREEIDQLPHEQKTILILHHYQKMSLREIAAIVGCSEKGVENRLYRTRKRLRSRMKPFLELISNCKAHTV
jgi:RNA polymerase sigma-70 factor (ECF subfamily)